MKKNRLIEALEKYDTIPCPAFVSVAGSERSIRGGITGTIISRITNGRYYVIVKEEISETD